MGQANTGLLIENENLFRALACAPIAILSSILAVDFAMSSGLIIFKVLLACMAIYFSLTAIAYAAYYTNEIYSEKSGSFIKNKNLFKVLVHAPIAIVFTFFAFNSVAINTHLIFTLVYGFIATYSSLAALGYAAFYTNERFK